MFVRYCIILWFWSKTSDFMFLLFDFRLSQNIVEGNLIIILHNHCFDIMIVFKLNILSNIANSLSFHINLSIDIRTLIYFILGRNIISLYYTLLINVNWIIHYTILSFIIHLWFHCFKLIFFWIHHRWVIRINWFLIII